MNFALSKVSFDRSDTASAKRLSKVKTKKSISKANNNQ